MSKPIARISKGRFSADEYETVKKLVANSATPLVPALKRLRGLLYYHAAVDPETRTVINVSIWEDLEAAKQMDRLQEMLAQRPILEDAGVTFDRIANYEPLWTIENGWLSGTAASTPA